MKHRYEYLDARCINCSQRISLAEKDLYAGYCRNCIRWGYINE